MSDAEGCLRGSRHSDSHMNQIPLAPYIRQQRLITQSESVSRRRTWKRHSSLQLTIAAPRTHGHDVVISTLSITSRSYCVMITLGYSVTASRRYYITTWIVRDVLTSRCSNTLNSFRLFRHDSVTPQYNVSQCFFITIIYITSLYAVSSQCCYIEMQLRRNAVTSRFSYVTMLLRHNSPTSRFCYDTMILYIMR